MHEQFAYATDAVYGVILGDLELVHAKSQALAGLGAPPGLPEGWQSYLDAMHVAAGNTAIAPTIEEAAADVLTVGRTCANCHATHHGPTPTVDEVLGAHWTGSTPMQRHSAGVYLMWVGLFLPSKPVFDAGVAQLSHENTIWDLIGEVPEAVRPLERQAHDLAARAGAAASEQERAGAFADLLRTCAGCHEQAGAKIPR
jgi:cytochrome c553